MRRFVWTACAAFLAACGGGEQAETVPEAAEAPAGLTAACLLSRNQVPVTVLEADPVYVGGISRTARYKGFHFDIGGHRFFSKSKIVEDLWTELLPNDLLHRPRSSKIYYRGKFYSYPLRAGEALRNLGVLEAARCVGSYARAKIAPIRDPANFEDWVSNHFGARLYRIFFKTYTEKVWGMSCREISADWAKQRITLLNLRDTILKTLFKPSKRNTPRTLVTDFMYPRTGGIGELARGYKRRIEEMGGRVMAGAPAIHVHREGNRVTKIEFRRLGGQSEFVTGDEYVSMLPMGWIGEQFQALCEGPAERRMRTLEIATDATDTNIFWAGQKR